MKHPKYSKNYCRELAANNGVEFVCFEQDNSYIFQCGDYRNGFYEYRLLESDMVSGNAEFMFANGLTNTNKGEAS